MAKVLKKLKVTEVSILTGDKLPANGESVVIKDAGSVEIIAKADKCIDGLVYCTIMKANTPDSDGEEADPATIQKAAHDFLKNSRTIDENHNHKGLDGVSVVQSYIDENGDWKAVFDVSDNAVMLEKAKKGEITGVSIYGKAEKVEKAGREFNAENTGMLKQMFDWLKSKFEKEQPQHENTENIKKEEGNEMPITKDELKAMLAEIEAEKKVPEASPAPANTEVETLKATIKTQGETIEKMSKQVEELAKARETNPGTQTGEVTLETIMKCTDPAKQAEMYETYRKSK